MVKEFYFYNKRVSNIESSLYDSLEFEICYVNICNHTFEVMYALLPPEEITTTSGNVVNKALGIFKPLKPYMVYEFENLFGFSGKCGNYRNDKMIVVY